MAMHPLLELHFQASLWMGWDALATTVVGMRMMRTVTALTHPQHVIGIGHTWTVGRRKPLEIRWNAPNVETPYAIPYASSHSFCLSWRSVEMCMKCAMKCVNNVDIPEFRSALSLNHHESSNVTAAISHEIQSHPEPILWFTKRWRVPQASQVDGMSPLQRGGLLALCTCSPRAERGEAGALPTMQLDRTARVLRRCRLHMANVIIVIDTYWHGNSCLNGDAASEMGAKTWFPWLRSGHRYHRYRFRGMPGYSLTEEGECEMQGLGFFVGTAAARPLNKSRCPNWCYAMNISMHYDTNMGDPENGWVIREL